MTEQRRKEDPRINVLVRDVAELKEWVAENTEVTLQVRDMLAGLRVLCSVAKWVTLITGAVAGTYAALKAGLEFHNFRK